MHGPIGYLIFNFIMDCSYHVLSLWLCIIVFIAMITKMSPTNSIFDMQFRYKSNFFYYYDNIILVFDYNVSLRPQDQHCDTGGQTRSCDLHREDDGRTHRPLPSSMDHQHLHL